MGSRKEWGRKDAVECFACGLLCVSLVLSLDERHRELTCPLLAGPSCLLTYSVPPSLSASADQKRDPDFVLSAFFT